MHAEAGVEAGGSRHISRRAGDKARLCYSSHHPSSLSPQMHFYSATKTQWKDKSALQWPVVHCKVIDYWLFTQPLIDTYKASFISPNMLVSVKIVLGFIYKILSTHSSSSYLAPSSFSLVQYTTWQIVRLCSPETDRRAEKWRLPIGCQP